MVSTLPSPSNPNASARLRSLLATAIDRTTAHQSALWALALLTLCLDVATTAYGLHLGLEEMNPLVVSLLPTLGLIGAFTVLKGWALAVGIVAWRLLPAAHRGLIPLGLAIPWAVAVTNNGVLLVGLLL